MIRREKTAALMAAALTIVVTLYSAWKLVGTGVLSWHAAQPDFYSMALETAAVWLILFLLFFCAKNCLTAWLGAAFLCAVFCWLHVIFLPMAFAGAYTVYLILAGRWFNRTVLRQNLGLCWDYLMGGALTITVFCLLSLAQLGSIHNLRLWVAASGLCLLMWAGMRLRGFLTGTARVHLRDFLTAPAADHMRGFMTAPSVDRMHGVMADPAADRMRGWLSGAGAPQPSDAPSCGRSHPGSSAMLAAILALLLLQAGRMNLAVDFDSIWYGVRSHVMLNSGNGIYENLGTLGVVYTYPKGWEVLGLPLAGLPSYSFSISMNLWMGALTLFAAYETARLCLKPRLALWLPFLMVSVPGIMNMADTAKPDMVTLFCQLLMIQGVLRFTEERRTGWLVAALAAGGVSLIMKPTAVVFSTAVAGISALWLLAHRKPSGSPGNPKEMRVWLILLPSATALIGIWGRTMKLVGVPVTSVFYGLFQKLGFEIKYPFYAAGLSPAGKHMPQGERLLFLAKRIYRFLLNPQGHDMAHVLIAWGAVLPVVFLVLRACLGGAGKTSRKPGTAQALPLSYFTWLLMAMSFINLVSLYSLSQVDGNYYMLYYVLILLTGLCWLDGKGPVCRKAALALLIPAWGYGVLLCGLTNWAWTIGNGGLHPVNSGYYSHIQEAQEKRTAQGSGTIWNILAANPSHRVIALGDLPDVLTFPCWVQSYVDVSGYWGNPQVVSSAPAFLEYLQFADVDYIYMERGYVCSGVRIYDIIRTLIEEGHLYNVCEEGGNLIISVQKGDPQPEITAEHDLEVFDNLYIQHP
ncbi:glycosyltransferase family 39 protein [Enterocloster sp.]|uniref:glycosyltransferase family 39 protein n=1 Tax=Enterocloster sp. TaxID=2719315 RepID=UPI00284089BF|nr:glycosyltransferase family 39 protein [Enterocloster sp.]MDR3757674.1 glycosyltransferase family 39 protein [Enterocloster sp.]